MADHDFSNYIAELRYRDQELLLTPNNEGALSLKITVQDLYKSYLTWLYYTIQLKTVNAAELLYQLKVINAYYLTLVQQAAKATETFKFPALEQMDTEEQKTETIGRISGALSAYYNTVDAHVYNKVLNVTNHHLKQVRYSRIGVAVFILGCAAAQYAIPHLTGLDVAWFSVAMLLSFVWVVAKYGLRDSSRKQTEPDQTTEVGSDRLANQSQVLMDKKHKAVLESVVEIRNVDARSEINIGTLNKAVKELIIDPAVGSQVGLDNAIQATTRRLILMRNEKSFSGLYSDYNKYINLGDGQFIKQDNDADQAIPMSKFDTYVDRPRQAPGTPYSAIN